MSNRYKFIDEKGEHLHTLDDKPLLGTTTILGVISKPLTWWAAGKACEQLGWLKSLKTDKKATREEKSNREAERFDRANQALSLIRVMGTGEYQQLLDKAYRAHHEYKEKRAGEGSNLHDLAEEWIKHKMSDAPPMSTTEISGFTNLFPFMEWCNKNVKSFLFSEIHCYSEKLWVGGKTDFAYEDMDGNYVLADIKSRDQDYFSDHIQCGFYDTLLRENGGLDKDGNVIWNTTDSKWFTKHAIFTLGPNFKEPVFSKSTAANREGALSALSLYKLKQEFEGD